SGRRRTPAATRVPPRAAAALARLRYSQSAHRHTLGRGTDQGAGLDGADDGAGGRDAETAADAVAATGPAGVDQVHLAAEGIDALDQQLGVLTRQSEEHTSELQSRENLVCRLLLEKKNITIT